MNREQPSKIGKVGYLLALMGVFLCIVPILDLLSLSLTFWDIPFLVLGILLIIIAYILASKDTYMRRLRWSFLMWRPSTIRTRWATFLVAVGGFWMIPMISEPIHSPFIFNPWGLDWLVTIVVGIMLIIGWTLVLTERENPRLMQEHDSTRT